MRGTGLAHGGTYMAFGTDAATASDAKLAMSSSVVVPAGGRLYFDNAYEFESDGLGSYFDGGKIEYSTNAGATWLDAGGLIDAGEHYSPVALTVFGGQTAFAGSSFGYSGTRLTLASLVGQSVRFRFRVVSDSFVGSLGWAVDNFAMYSCVTPVAPAITLHPSNQTVNAGQTASFTSTASGTPAPTVKWQVSSGGPYTDIPGATSTTYSFATASGDNGKSYHAVFTNSAGSATSNAATLTVNSAAQTLTVSKVGTGAGTVTSSPGGISCGATCSASFAFGTVVTLTLNPATGSTFTAWGGACLGLSPQLACVVTMSAARSVTAQFTRQTGSLSVTLGGLPSGTVVTLGITGPDGFNTTNATLTGTGLNLSDSGRAPTRSRRRPRPSAGTTYSALVQSVAVNFGATATINVTYSTQTAQTLTVSKTGTGTGSVTSSPAGIACGATCAASFTFGTSVTLSATPAAGSSFAGWSGSGCTGTGTCVLAMSAARSVAAQFDSAPIATVIPDDFDGNGTSDLAVFRPAGGQWFINGVSSPLFGVTGASPCPATTTATARPTSRCIVPRPASGSSMAARPPSSSGGGPVTFPCRRTTTATRKPTPPCGAPPTATPVCGC